MPRVDVVALECREQELHWRCIITVRAGEDDWNAQVLEQPQGVIAFVIWRIVHLDHVILAPGRPLLIQHLDQMYEEYLHDLAIIVSLDEAVEYLTIGVQGRDHGYPRHDLQLSDGIGGVRPGPLSSSEIGHSEPGLINIQDNLLGQIYLEKCQGELLPHDEVLPRVCRQHDRLHLPISHSKLLPYGLQNMVSFKSPRMLFL